MELTNFLHAGTNSCKLKGSWAFGVNIIKKRCDEFGGGFLRLSESEEWTVGITDFLHVDTDSQKVKVVGHGTLKLTVSQN